MCVCVCAYRWHIVKSATSKNVIFTSDIRNICHKWDMDLIWARISSTHRQRVVMSCLSMSVYQWRSHAIFPGYRSASIAHCTYVHFEWCLHSFYSMISMFKHIINRIIHCLMWHTKTRKPDSTVTNLSYIHIYRKTCNVCEICALLWKHGQEGNTLLWGQGQEGGALL